MRVWLAALACLATPVLAGEQPRLIPSGDVDVMYRVSGPAADQIPGGAPDGVRLQWDAGSQRLRSEPVGGPIYAITDLGRHVADVVFAGQKSYLELPLRIGSTQALLSGAVLADADARFRQQGTKRLLGMLCTQWSVHTAKLDATGCITADGIVLEADGTWDGQAGSVRAVSVSRSQTADARFRPPEGYFRIGLKAGR